MLSIIFWFISGFISGLILSYLLICYDVEEDIKIIHIAGIITLSFALSFFGFITSIALITTLLLLKYGDKVVIKRRKKEE